MATGRVLMTFRVKIPTADAIRANAKATGLSMNDVGGAILDRAITEGWTVEPGTSPQASGPGHSPTIPPLAGAGPEQEQGRAPSHSTRPD